MNPDARAARRHFERQRRGMLFVPAAKRLKLEAPASMMPRKNLSRLKKLTGIVVIPLALLLHPVAARSQVHTELWEGQRAMASIAELLRFTPRSMDTAGHQKTIDFITSELAKSKVDLVKTQRWVFNAADGKQHAMTNIIARFDP